MSYARAVVSEGLRLFPPAFVLVRQAIGDDRWQDIAFPGGSLVLISPWVLHHHRRHWTNPDAFDPSRFLESAPAIPRLAYLPFGAGPRVCVGAQFALTEAALVLALMLKRFDVRLAETGPVYPMAVVTTQPDHHALFLLRSRTR